MPDRPYKCSESSTIIYKPKNDRVLRILEEISSSYFTHVCLSQYRILSKTAGAVCQTESR